MTLIPAQKEGGKEKAKSQPKSSDIPYIAII
jgi:hypothetical protein